MKKFATIIFCIFLTSIALSQQEYEEVVYLKNGSVIKGTIIEQVPDVSIKIQTKDGNVFVYKMEEIERITKEPVQSSLQADNGVHQHDGFFLRFAPGFGTASTIVDVAGIDAFEFSGLAYSSRLQIGGAVSDNVIIYGEIGGDVYLSPTVKAVGEEVEVTDVTVNPLGFGAGVSYYIMPANIYFSLSLLMSTITVEVDGETIESDIGFGFKVLAGKEWWAGEDWGLGIAVFGSYSSMDVNKIGGQDVTDVIPSISNTAFGILFSITYN